ncbi:DnaJ domain containing protein [Trichomonas vaginalis G3]|uniref:DnaJ domain containing protein n=1 Tax=Trichomonas vaginalis (strain ATCC PRA-98 / G3) TaxID=412133 RepID=A2DLB5_TRIV3|nr:zinc ion binding [Trichomonas vaginalis G3]EAY18733.1 DnaJ domain containing protein [Trichomonas vaginalis G3]KAI5510159.1 zinc ion binding [Trichomonas vaginalis G3]|eukprot:XP_001579719.1 DnaJ domain containing protein [Trichomonas vaginalis G3]
MSSNWDEDTDYYTLLDVKLDASTEEINAAYRKASNKWNPEKYNGNKDEAKRILHLIEHAYSILSDSRERTWYDNHKNFAYEELEDFYELFKANAYSGFGNDENSFYTKFDTFFGDVSRDENQNAPKFGDAKSSRDDIEQFYNYWSKFNTLRTVSVDEIDDNNRQEDIIQEYTDIIHELAYFLKKRDPRLKNVEEKTEKIKRQKSQKKTEALASQTFLTQIEHVQTTFEKKYLEMMGNRQERRIDLPGLSPQLIAKKTELEQIQAELQQARQDQEKWESNLEEDKALVNEHRKDAYQIEQKTQEIFKHLRAEIENHNRNRKKQESLTKQYEDELEELTVTEKELQQKIQGTQNEISKLQPYSIFFEDVVTRSKLFLNTEQILNRFNLLMQAKDVYSRSTSEEKEVKKEEVKDENYDDGDDKVLELRKPETNGLAKAKEELKRLQGQRIQLVHQVYSLREDIKKLQKKNRYVKTNAIKGAERVSDKQTDYVTIMSSIDNIMKMVKATQESLGRIYTTTEKIETPEAKLELIEKRFQDLVAIISESKEEVKDNASQASSARGKKTPIKVKKVPIGPGTPFISKVEVPQVE